MYGVRIIWLYSECATGSKVRDSNPGKQWRTQEFCSVEDRWQRERG